MLGFAHVRDSGKRTARGATIWRAADGACPDGHLTPKAAEDALAAILEDARRARPPEPEGATLEQAVDAWLTYLEVERKRKPSTLKDARSVARGRLLAHFGAETPVKSLTTEDVDDYRRALLEEGLAPRTVQKILVLLHGILRLAKRRKLIAGNPAEDAERVEVVDDGVFNILDRDEFEDVYRAVLGELDRRPQGEREEDEIDTLDQDGRELFGAALSTGFYAGLRMGEKVDLPRRGVDFRGRMIRVESGFTDGARSTPKSKRARSTPLVSILAERLLALRNGREHYRASDDYVFGIAGRRISAARIRAVFYAGLVRAGLGHRREKADQHGNPQNPIRVHDLRHSFCTWAVNVWPVTKVKEFAGHRDIKTTMRYVHHQAKIEDADAADAFLSGP
jgi:integrase